DRRAHQRAACALFVRRRLPPHGRARAGRHAAAAGERGADPRRGRRERARRRAELLGAPVPGAGALAAAAGRARARRLGRPSQALLPLTKTSKLVLLFLAVVLPAGCERAAAERNAAQ